MFFLPLIITLEIKEGNCLVYYISFNSSNSCYWKCGGSNGHLMVVKHVSCLYLVGREREWCTSLDLFQPQSAVILRSAVQNDLMLRNWRVSRVIAEPPWQHFLHGDNAAPPLTSSAREQQPKSQKCVCALFLWMKMPSHFLPPQKSHQCGLERN